MLLDTYVLTGAAGLPVAAFDHDQSAMITGARRHDVYGMEKVLTFYRIWAANRSIPAAFEFLTELHRDTAGSLARVLAFLRGNLRRAEADDRFRTEISRTTNADDPETCTVHKGKVGNTLNTWRATTSPLSMLQSQHAAVSSLSSCHRLPMADSSLPRGPFVL